MLVMLGIGCFAKAFNGVRFRPSSTFKWHSFEINKFDSLTLTLTMLGYLTFILKWPKATTFGSRTFYFGVQSYSFIVSVNNTPFLLKS